MATLDIISSESLYDRLAAKLPLGSTFQFHHISTPPTKCDPLFAAPPGRKPEQTYCESHFLTVSASKDDRKILLFAVEILVFTTKRLTTIFVSKADSTGCLAALQLPKGGASLISTTASELVAWLVEHRQRPRVRCVVSLFARAQGQYLFPRSVENKGKHVLDDRQLVKWWCKTLDPVLRNKNFQSASQAYVIVPGFDKAETTAFFPPSWRQDPVEGRKWHFGHPLETISSNPNVPPRCLVPRFPDDPKARYLDELDEEIPDSQNRGTTSSPSKKGNGMWKSIKNLSQFWEMMAFRQECSSGRMVGFIWVVFTPPDIDSQTDDDTESVFSSPGSPSLAAADLPSISEVLSQDSHSSSKSTRERSRRPLTGPIIPRAPRIKKTSSSLSISSHSEESLFWKWPESSRGQVVLEKPQYDRIHDLLLKLDFSNNDAAAQSTAKWLEEAATIVGVASRWGQSVVGKMQIAAKPNNGTSASGTAGQPNDLSASIVRKKRKPEESLPAAEAPGKDGVPGVNVLSASMIRKKPKVR